ncbi:MAG TPA: cupredoxin domain-containing protein [Arthrobacter sp.]|nr:cupredoxin domain-containing protein [Arthrobacter sp.]
MDTAKIRIGVVLSAALLGVAGCAQGGGTAAPPGGSATASAPASAGMPMDSASSGAGTGPGASTGTAAGASLTIKDFAYGPTLQVAAGSTVTVTNMDSAAHTVTADEGGAFDVTIKGSGGTATFKAPSAPGTYAYHCTYHPGMHGTLVVK